MEAFTPTRDNTESMCPNAPRKRKFICYPNMDMFRTPKKAKNEQQCPPAPKKLN